MDDTRKPPTGERWAHLRFAVIGALLAAPPDKGALRDALMQLAARDWTHPSTGKPCRFAFSTLERWYYQALREGQDPVGVLRRKLRADRGRQRAVTPAVRDAVLAQYHAHPSWSAQLHTTTSRRSCRPTLRSATCRATPRSAASCARTDSCAGAGARAAR